MSGKFEITYFPYPQLDLKTGAEIEVYRPTVPIQVYFSIKKTTPFQALVDSGADRNLFNAEIAIHLGIKLKSVEPQKIYGIGKSSLVAYTHKVTMHIEKYMFETEIDFTENQRICLLGRNGFFDKFKRIAFKEKKKIIEFKY